MPVAHQPNPRVARTGIRSTDLFAMSVLFDWRIQEIERNANEAHRRLCELDTLRSDVGRLECALREARTEADGLRDELRSTQDRLQQLEYRVEEMANK